MTVLQRPGFGRLPRIQPPADIPQAELHREPIPLPLGKGLYEPVSRPIIRWRGLGLDPCCVVSYLNLSEGHLRRGTEQPPDLAER